jgi:hypothetical protein
MKNFKDEHISSNMLINPIPLGSINSKSELTKHQDKNIMKISIQLKDAKEGVELLRLFPAKNNFEYEYILENDTINRNFEIKSIKFYVSENIQKSLYTLAISKRLDHTGYHKFKIISKIKGVEDENMKINVLIEIF